MKKWLWIALLVLSGCEQSPQTLKSETKPVIMFDTSHGETAGEADWVIDGAFSSFADALKKDGYTVKEAADNALISDQLLAKTNVYVLPEPNIPLKKSEQQALKKFAENGGSLLMISDHYNADRNLNRYDASEVLNGYRRGAYNNPTKGMTSGEKSSDAMKDVQSSDFLSDTFGVRFRYNALSDIKMTNIQDVFSINKGVHTVQMHAGSTIAITDPKQAKGIVYLPSLNQTGAWDHAVDQGVYNHGGVDEGAFVAISKPAKGKAAFIGDSSIVEDDTAKYKREDNGREKTTYDGFSEADHRQLLLNIVHWLAQKEDYTSFAGKVKLDQPTPLLPMENPKNSTEPKYEPWATPARGYLWYDRSTFAQGSYGASQQSSTNVTLDNAEIDGPSQVSPSEHVQFKIRTSKAMEVKIDIVMSNGQHVGLFDGRAPGESKNYTTRNKGSYYESYYNGKIAREAFGTLTVKAISGQNVIAEKTIEVK